MILVLFLFSILFVTGSGYWDVRRLPDGLANGTDGSLKKLNVTNLTVTNSFFYLNKELSDWFYDFDNFSNDYTKYGGWKLANFTTSIDRITKLNISGLINISSGQVNATKFYGGFDGVPKNGTDAEIVNFNLTGDMILNVDINISPYFLLVDTPNLPLQVVNKGYVDDATSSTAFDFFFNTNASDIAGHLNMTERDLDNPETTIDSASLPAGSTTTIFNWTTLFGQPEFNELRNGVYDVHIHLNKNLFGARDVAITPKLYNISGDGSKQTLLITFETSKSLTTSVTGYNLHGVLSDPIMLADDARLSIQMEAVVSGGGSNPVVTVTLEGITDSHLSVQTSSNAFEKIFVRRDGKTPLTSDWNTGDFRIIGMKEIRTNNDKVNISSSGDVNATKFYGDGSALTGIAAGTTITANQTFGVIVGFTSETHSGNMTNPTTGRIGYINANFLCDTDFRGSHFCTQAEIVKDIAAGNISIEGTYWMARGAPGFTAEADDCAGWNKNASTSLGPFWNFDLPGAGVGKLTNCEQKKKLACCGDAY